MLPAYFGDRKFQHATAVMIGTMVGVGIYGIPFAFAKAGFWVGTMWLAALAGVMVLFNLMFAELALSTQGDHQVSGYINIWLGPWARRIFAVSYLLSIYGALLAYIIVVGEFLHNILSNFFAVDPLLYSLVFAGLGSLVWLLRVRTVAAIERVLVLLYFVAVALIAIVGARHIQWVNFTGWSPEFWYLPYGVILFSLAGMSAVPIQRKLLAGRERWMRPAILWAVGLVVLLYVVFAFVVVGISGDITSPESLSGMFGLLGSSIIILGSILGVLTITSSYFILGTALYETFHIDYRQYRPAAWFLTLAPPVGLFLLGQRNFIDIIGLCGAVAVGAMSILLLAAYLKARNLRLRVPEIKLKTPVYLVWLLMLIFVAGVVYTLVW